MSDSSRQKALIEQLERHGITDQRVLAAMAAVPRERFVLPEYADQAFDDHALPIDSGQTISQPYMVALMTQELALGGEERVLEIGTGSGYQAAILARLCRHVTTIERFPELSEKAQRTLAELGCANVECRVGDGSRGWPEAAPFDGIIVTAGAPDVPPDLYAQLRMGGRLVIPVGRGRPQMLQTIIRQERGPEVRDVCECSFVPLIGEGGWAEEDE